MQVTFDLPNKLVQQIQTLPNQDHFVCEALEIVLQQQKPAHLSKWAKIAQRIEQSPLEVED